MIKEILAHETLSLRQRVLREGLSVDLCRFDGDELEDTFHFGYFLEDQIKGIITCVMSDQNQIRGMAVDPGKQGKGIGSALLKKVIEALREKKQKSVWCNARTHAIPFYKKHSFFIEGDRFIIKGVGEHFKMSHNL